MTQHICACRHWHNVLIPIAYPNSASKWTSLLNEYNSILLCSWHTGETYHLPQDCLYIVLVMYVACVYRMTYVKMCGKMWCGLCVILNRKKEVKQWIATSWLIHRVIVETCDTNNYLCVLRTCWGSEHCTFLRMGITLA